MKNRLQDGLVRIAALSSLVAAALAPVSAHAQWVLTPQYLVNTSFNMAWSVTTLASGFNTLNRPYYDFGYDTIYGFAYGVSPKYNGGNPYLMVAEAFNGTGTTPNKGGLVVFNSNANGQLAPLPVSPLQTPMGMASVGGQVYAAFQSGSSTAAKYPNSIVQVNPDGTTGASFALPTNQAFGLVVNPLNGHLLATATNEPQIYDIDVVGGTVKTLMTMKASNGLSITGAMGLATDGKRLFVVAWESDGLEHVVQFPVPTTDGATMTSVYDYGAISGARGISLSLGATAGYLYVNCRTGQLYQIDAAWGGVVLLASRDAGLNNGCFAGVDPIDGSLLVEQNDIARFTPSGFSPVQYPIPVLPSPTLAFNKTMQGSVSLAVPSPVDTVIELTSTPIGTVLLPKFVTIKAGASSATFTIQPTDYGPVTILAEYSLPSRVTVEQSVNLTVTHN